MLKNVEGETEYCWLNVDDEEWPSMIENQKWFMVSKSCIVGNKRYYLFISLPAEPRIENG